MPAQAAGVCGISHTWRAGRHFPGGDRPRFSTPASKASVAEGYPDAGGGPSPGSGGQSQAAPRTPLLSPWRLRRTRVASLSLKA